MAVLLPEQVRDSIPVTELPHVNAGTPRNFNFGVICSGWMSLVGSTLYFHFERSLNNKATWVGFGGGDVICGSLGKGATQAEQIANAKKFGSFWDGQEMDVRVWVDVAPTPFAWGLETI